MADESLREIQLDGKQLVFLFMAATVVAVVIFLSGVMVGRGVRAPVATDVATAADVIDDPTAPVSSTTATPSTASGASASSNEKLTYPGRLEGDDPPPENLEDTPDPTAPVVRPSETRATNGPESAPSRPAATMAAAPAAAVAKSPSAASPAESKSATPGASATPVPSEPAGSGYVVQVAATKQRGEADTIAKRLSGKGYPAFVTTPPSGPQMFRVRVGKYQDRKEADRIATRLEREEQFKPWITR